MNYEKNYFPMRDWHSKHMEKIIVRFIEGLSPDATNKEKSFHKRYVNIFNVCREINNDIKHGVTTEEVLVFLQKLRKDPSFSKFWKNPESMNRLDAIEKCLQEISIQLK